LLSRQAIVLSIDLVDILSCGDPNTCCVDEDVSGMEVALLCSKLLELCADGCCLLGHSSCQYQKLKLNGIELSTNGKPTEVMSSSDVSRVLLLWE
jgi:hypothetical protein